MTRIVAGVCGGMPLSTPRGQGTRPTSSRVREAVASAIVSWGGEPGAPQPLAGLAVLDLFAGSGAMGLELASRGAAPVMCVESSRPAAEVIRANAQSTGLSVEVRQHKVEALLATDAPRAFDVCWADPPYAVDPDIVVATVSQALESGWLMSDGLFMVERGVRSTAPDLSGLFAQQWDRRYGDTVIYFATGAAQ